jgi:hypothetical protein
VYIFFSGKALLVNTLVYSVFVRIWYDYNTYAVFKTNGIFVMTQAPVLATKLTTGPMIPSQTNIPTAEISPQ